MWHYRGRQVTDSDIPDGAIGFVYKITMFNNEKETENHKKARNAGFETSREGTWGKFYIGKKLLISSRKTTISKRAQAKQLLETGDKRKVKKVQRVTKSSNWMTYNSSCKALQEDIKNNPELCYKEILLWCYSKKELSYREEHAQHLHDVLERESYNNNIGGRFFCRDLIKVQ
jgi:hypothetical protein